MGIYLNAFHVHEYQNQSSARLNVHWQLSILLGFVDQRGDIFPTWFARGYQERENRQALIQRWFIVGPLFKRVSSVKPTLNNYLDRRRGWLARNHYWGGWQGASRFPCSGIKSRVVAERRTQSDGGMACLSVGTNIQNARSSPMRMLHAKAHWSADERT